MPQQPGEYKPPFDAETMQALGPGYWRNETSGKLGPAVERYLTGKVLNTEEIAYLRAYLRQWVNAPIWNFNPHLKRSGFDVELQGLRDEIDSLTDAKRIKEWLWKALEIGIDPL